MARHYLVISMASRGDGLWERGRGWGDLGFVVETSLLPSPFCASPQSIAPLLFCHARLLSQGPYQAKAASLAVQVHFMDRYFYYKIMFDKIS